jgi:hypothetical protein
MAEETKTILIEVPLDIYERLATQVVETTKTPIVFPKQIGEEMIKEVRKSFSHQTEQNEEN